MTFSRTIRDLYRSTLRRVFGYGPPKSPEASSPSSPVDAEIESPSTNGDQDWVADPANHPVDDLDTHPTDDALHPHLPKAGGSSETTAVTLQMADEAAAEQTQTELESEHTPKHKAQEKLHPVAGQRPRPGPSTEAEIKAPPPTFRKLTRSDVMRSTVRREPRFGIIRTPMVESSISKIAKNCELIARDRAIADIRKHCADGISLKGSSTLDLDTDFLIALRESVVALDLSGEGARNEVVSLLRECGFDVKIQS